ncbi:carboxylesterase family protein [Secundilactobacillus hailunensis]|uniref:Carboxylic ester hydrolase n=1 Tax=Secundilactobacillus hailunensis TaxID=2559923 RepID=A0ABW1T897_9LACO|nr:carboxylesterase family protein [Secundilactobacillus hailunensis]
MKISTTSGIVAGTQQNGHYRFTGIPFGEAERFKRPQPYHKGGTQPVNIEQIQPLQPLMKVSPEQLKDPIVAMFAPAADTKVGEECLNLRVTTPNVKGKLPVVIDIFGGGFTMGGNSITPTMRWLEDAPVVYVAINYRVSILGWSCFREGDTNCGLYDQALAIKWVVSNIAQFGGDPGKITLVGSSAGAKSISALMASNFDVMDQIKNVWTVSGAFQTIRDMKTAQKISERFLTTNELSNGRDLLTATPDTIIAAIAKYNDHANTNDFGPVIDEEAISSSWPDVLQERLNLHPYAVVVSSSSNEYGMQTKMAKGNPAILRQSANDLFGENADLVLKGTQTAAEMGRAIGYAMYRLPADRAAQRYATNANTTVYNLHASVLGGTHTSDALLMNLATALPDSRPLIKQLQAAFLAFVQTGKPTLTPEVQLQWPVYRSDSKRILQLSNAGFSIDRLSSEITENPLPVQALIL